MCVCCSVWEGGCGAWCGALGAEGRVVAAGTGAGAGAGGEGRLCVYSARATYRLLAAHNNAHDTGNYYLNLYLPHSLPRKQI